MEFVYKQQNGLHGETILILSPEPNSQEINPLTSPIGLALNKQEEKL